MCGICGTVSADRAYLASADDILAMRDTLTHRGPDDAGYYIVGGIALGSRRLAILDLSARGHMPMKTPDGRFWITYNGEVYNYRELRATLEARGHEFSSDTDTEVILRLYAEEGPRMLPRLNGMFAIAIWDSAERTLFLARDRMGVKPLYYASRNGMLQFASEEKALFAAGCPREFDPDTWEELLCFRYVSGERTPFKGVCRLLPGHFLLWRDGVERVHRWWCLAERAQELKEKVPRDADEWFRELFDNAVALRRISDVPVGVLLSGGLDSSSVAASLASQAGDGVASFTVRFEEAGYDEGPLARKVAGRWGLESHDLIVSPKQLLARLYEASWLNDEPLVHGNDVHLLAISDFAKPRVTVLLSGEGGDETLNGYVRYQPLRYPAMLDAARPVLPKVISALNVNGRARKLSRFLSLGSTERFLLFNSCDTLPDDLAQLGMSPTTSFPFRERILAESKELYPRDFIRRAMYSDQHTFLCSILDRNDRMTMGASIECRVPFLDYRLIEGLAALPSSVLISGKRTKPLLRRSLGHRLPEAVRRYRKWGFGVPWNEYLRCVPEFRSLVEQLADIEPIREGPFMRAQVKQVTREFLLGDNRHQMLIRQLVMIAVWHEAVFRTRWKSAAGSRR